MYQMSQSYCGGNCSHLEYVAHSAVSYNPSSPSSGYNFQSSSRGYSFSSLESSAAYHSGSSSSGGYSSSSVNYLQFKPQTEYLFSPEVFLQPGREGSFVGKAEEVRSFVEEAFEKMFHEEFPRDVKVTVCSEEQFRKLAPHPSTIGLSINRRKAGLISEIFVLQGSLARVMLTLGHELGHVLTETLDNKHDEEAKAYAFSLAWMRVIQENNIGELGGSFVTERPAENGLHNVAFAFVEKMIKAGFGAWEIYLKLIKNFLSVSV